MVGATGKPVAIAVTGGLNIANAYFRTHPAEPDDYWRDQDVVLRGAVVRDLVAAFDRNFDYFVGVKKSRGIFDTNLYWGATRAVLDNLAPQGFGLPQKEAARPSRMGNWLSRLGWVP